MIKNIFTAILAGCLALVAVSALAGPEGTVRGDSRDRVAVLSVKDFNLKTLESKVVLVAFWNSKCPTCQAYIDWLTVMQERYGEEGLVVVAVNQDKDSAAAADLMNKIHPRTQVVLDPTAKMASGYQLEAMPSSYLYNRNLEMKAKFVGFVPEETKPTEAEIVKLLEQEYKE